MPKWMAEHRFCLGGNPGTACAATHPAISLFGATGRHRCLMSKCQNRRVKIWSQAVTRPDQIQGAALSTARLIAAPKQDGATVSGDKLDRCLDAPIARAEKRLEAHRATRAAPPKPWGIRFQCQPASRNGPMSRAGNPAGRPACAQASPCAQADHVDDDGRSNGQDMRQVGVSLDLPVGTCGHPSRLCLAAVINTR